jgi:hypothetical protein
LCKTTSSSSLHLPLSSRELPWGKEKGSARGGVGWPAPLGGQPRRAPAGGGYTWGHVGSDTWPGGSARRLGTERRHAGPARGCGLGGGAPARWLGWATVQGWGLHAGVAGARARPYHEKRRKTENKNREAHRGRGPLSELRRNSSIDGDSEVQSLNRTHRDEALVDTNTAVLSDSADHTRIGSNCSSELESLQTSISYSERWGMNLRKPFHDSECAQQGEAIHIYIARIQTR